MKQLRLISALLIIIITIGILVTTCISVNINKGDGIQTIEDEIGLESVTNLELKLAKNMAIFDSIQAREEREDIREQDSLN